MTDGFYLRSLDERLKESARQRDRYWADPQYRLDRVNRARARYGLPPRQSVAEINPWGKNDRALA